jgi:hypothetical protein
MNNEPHNGQGHLSQRLKVECPSIKVIMMTLSIEHFPYSLAEKEINKYLRLRGLRCQPVIDPKMDFDSTLCSVLNRESVPFDSDFHSIRQILWKRSKRLYMTTDDIEELKGEYVTLFRLYCSKYGIVTTKELSL